MSDLLHVSTAATYHLSRCACYTGTRIQPGPRKYDPTMARCKGDRSIGLRKRRQSLSRVQTANYPRSLQRLIQFGGVTDRKTLPPIAGKDLATPVSIARARAGLSRCRRCNAVKQSTSLSQTRLQNVPVTHATKMPNLTHVQRSSVLRITTVFVLPHYQSLTSRPSSYPLLPRSHKPHTRSMSLILRMHLLLMRITPRALVLRDIHLIADGPGAVAPVHSHRLMRSPRTCPSPVEG